MKDKNKNKTTCEHCGKEIDIDTAIKIATCLFIGEHPQMYVCDEKCRDNFFSAFRRG